MTTTLALFEKSWLELGHPPASLQRRVSPDPQRLYEAQDTQSAWELWHRAFALQAERCAGLLELSRSSLLLLAGEMTAQEMRSVQAVLANRAKTLRELA